MAELSIFADICNLRWPGVRVSGSGSIAVYLGCDYRVVLCEVPLQAAQVQTEKCCARCHAADNSDWHSVHYLNAVEEETPYRPRRHSASFRRMVDAA